MSYAHNVSNVLVRAGRSFSLRRRSHLLLALFAAVFAASCAQPATTAKRDPATLRMGVASPIANAPGFGIRNIITNLSTDPLLGIDLDGRPSGRIVESWSWSDDRLELRLRLRKGLRFHDGTPVDAASFKESFQQTLKDPRQRRAAVSYESITGLETVDDDVLVLKLSRRESFLLTDLANTVLAHPNKADVGLGPYRVVQREPKAVLTAFENYHGGRPAIDVVELHPFEEQRSSWAALMRGEIDAVNEISPTAVDFVPPNVRTYPFTRPYYIQLVFNVQHPILKDKLVRQALSYAVDRQAIINLGLNRQGTVAEGPIWPFHWAYSSAERRYSHNLEAARLRLDGAGYRIPTSVPPGSMPKRFSFSCLTLKDARFERMGIVLQQQLYELGVDMKLEAVTLRELNDRIVSGKFDTLLAERTSGRSLAWAYLSFHSSQGPMKYAAADRVLDSLRIASDESTRETVSEFQKILYDDPPAIFIAWPEVSRAVSNKFNVYDKSSAGPATTDVTEKNRDIMSSIPLWKPADVDK